MKRRHPVIYVLHSSELYGTERMALMTAQGLSDDFETIFLGPPGVALDEAKRLGFETGQYRTNKQLAYALQPLLKRYPSLTFVGTGPRYSLVCIALNLFYRRHIRNIQIVHGGTGEWFDYGRKKYLNFFDITFIAVSEWSKQKLIDYGVKNPIEVVGNFLVREKNVPAPLRPAYTGNGYRNALLVARVDPLKKVDLLLDALDRRPEELREIHFRVLGVGDDLGKLKERAARTHPNVEFVGFTADVAGELARADLFVHTCSVESFGLAVLEAMSSRLVTLVPNAGGTATLVEDGKSGFAYRANDADHLAARLIELKNTGAEKFNELAGNAVRRVQTHFSAEASLRRYRELFSTLPTFPVDAETSADLRLA